MAYKLKKQKLGRPPVHYKIRNLEGITPRGFEFDRIEGNTAIYKRKEKKKHEK